MNWFAVAHALKQVIEFQWPVYDESDPRHDEVETARNRFYLPRIVTYKRDETEEDDNDYTFEDLDIKTFVNWSPETIREQVSTDAQPFIVITDGGAAVDSVDTGDGRNRAPLGRKIVEYLLHVNLIVYDSGQRGTDVSYTPRPQDNRDAINLRTYHGMSILPYQIVRRIAAFPVLTNVYATRGDDGLVSVDDNLRPDIIDDRNPIRSADVVGWTRQYDWDSSNLRWNDIAGYAFNGFLIVVRVIQEVDFGIGTVERGGQNKYSVGFKESDNNVLLPETVPTGGVGTPLFPEYLRARNN